MTRLILTALLLTLTASAQTPESAVNITVRLFSTQSVNALTITPLSPNANYRTCPTCPTKPIPTKLELTTATKPLTLEGLLHLTAASDKQITAAGHWQITPTPTGLKILLTLPSERYVIAALAGEAAPDEPPQSLRALAVAIRTFALTNLNRHQPEAFDLCDSTHCQALRFTTPRPEIEQAVRDTAGETLWFGSQPGSRRATIYYTQSCGGQTESASNLWPTEHEPYLTGHPDPYCIRRTPAAWHAQITLAELTTIARQQNWHLPATIESIRITKRTPTGRALTLELTGKDLTGKPETAQISASSLHFALDRELGWNQLRSDWYTVTLSNAALHFDGKGYGHGVGLCQTGAHQMATEGHTYREILAFYFPGTHTGITPTDQGWQQTQNPDWTLLTTQPNTPLPQLIAPSLDQSPIPLPPAHPHPPHHPATPHHRTLPPNHRRTRLGPSLHPGHPHLPPTPLNPQQKRRRRGNHPPRAPPRPDRTRVHRQSPPMATRRPGRSPRQPNPQHPPNQNASTNNQQPATSNRSQHPPHQPNQPTTSPNRPTRSRPKSPPPHPNIWHHNRKNLAPHRPSTPTPEKMSSPPTLQECHPERCANHESKSLTERSQNGACFVLCSCCCLFSKPTGAPSFPASPGTVGHTSYVSSDGEFFQQIYTVSRTSTGFEQRNLRRGQLTAQIATMKTSVETLADVNARMIPVGMIRTIAARLCRMLHRRQTATGASTTRILEPREGCTQEDGKNSESAHADKVVPIFASQIDERKQEA